MYSFVTESDEQAHMRAKGVGKEPWRLSNTATTSSALPMERPMS